MKKRFLALLLALCMMVGVLPATAAANDQAALMYRNCWINNGEATESNDYSTNLTGSPGDSIPLRFYTGTSENATLTTAEVSFTPNAGTPENAVTLSKLTTENGPGGSVAYPANCWRVQFNTFGSGTLNVTVGTTKYSMSVSTVVPNMGFFTDKNNLSEATFIPNGSAYIPGQAFYYVVKHSDRYIDNRTVTCDNSNVNAELVEDGTVADNGGATRYAIKLTVLPGTVGDLDFCVNYSVTYKDQGAWTQGDLNRLDGRNLRLTDNTQQLMYRNCWQGPNELEVSERSQYSVTGTPGDGISIVFYYGTGSSNALISPTSVSFTPDSGTDADAVTIINVTEGSTPYWRVSLNSFGSGMLTVEDSSGTYSLPVAIELPDYGFYTSQVASPDTFRNELVYADLTADASGNKAVWLIKRGGFTENEKSIISVHQITWDNSNEIDILWQGSWETRSDGNYDLKITLPKASGQDQYILRAEMPTTGPDGQSETFYPASINVRANTPGNAAYVTGSDGTQYVVGFASREAGEIIDISEGTWSTGNGTIAEKNADNQRNSLPPFTVMAGTRQTAEAGAHSKYTEAQNVSLNVKEMRIVPDGDCDTGTYSFDSASAETAAVLTKTSDFTTNQTIADVVKDVPNSAYVYVKDGYTGGATIYADVEITPPGAQTVTATVSVRVCIERIYQLNWDRRDLSENGNHASDTVEKLNQFLKDKAAELSNPPTPDHTTICQLVLDNTTYVGTIEIPDFFTENNGYPLSIMGSQGAGPGSQGTKLQGSVDLNGCNINSIVGVDFSAPTGTDTRAIYNGSCQLDRCTFKGYDVAVDSTAGIINVTSFNRFVNNKIAVKLDCGNAASHLTTSRNTWENNDFIGNNVAVSISSLAGMLDPYHLRFVNCNFVSNGMDFDVPMSDSFYFHRNYYGELNPDRTADEFFGADSQASLNALATRRPAKINSTAKISANPRWAFPIYRGGNSINPYDNGNYLVIDTSNLTRIPQEEASSLSISSAAFENLSDTLAIDVVDYNEETKTDSDIGSWEFTPAVNAAVNASLQSKVRAASANGTSENDFDPYIGTSNNGPAIIVQINDSFVLSSKHPILHIPCSFASVTVTGPNGATISATVDSGVVSFQVSAGGSYTISNDNPGPSPDQMIGFYTALAPDGTPTGNRISMERLGENGPSCYVVSYNVGQETKIYYFYPGFDFTGSTVTLLQEGPGGTAPEGVSIGKGPQMLTITLSQGVSLSGMYNLQWGVGTNTSNVLIQFSPILTIPEEGKTNVNSIPADLIRAAEVQINGNIYYIAPKKGSNNPFIHHTQWIEPSHSEYWNIGIGVWTKVGEDLFPVEGPPADDILSKITNLRIEMLPTQNCTAYPAGWTNAPVTELHLTMTPDNAGTWLPHITGSVGDNSFEVYGVYDLISAADYTYAPDSIDSLDIVSAHFADLVSSAKQDVIYTFVIPNGTYTGTIQMPETAPGIQFRISAPKNGTVTIKGGVVGNSARTYLENLDFVSEDDKTKYTNGNDCVTGSGEVVFHGCSFSGFNRAIVCTGDLRWGGDTTTFSGNHIALELETTDRSGGDTMMNRCTFQGNDIALNLMQFGLRPTAYELIQCSFIDNNCDVKNSTGRWFFMPRCYIQHTGADKPHDVTVCPYSTNGVSAFPVATNNSFTAFDFSEPTPTVANGQSGLIPVESLDCKVITVISSDDTTDTIEGTWTFEDAGNAGASQVLHARVLADGPFNEPGPVTGFDPTITIISSDQTAITLQVSSNGDTSTILDQKKPTLRIPCFFGAVNVTGPDGKPISAKVENGAAVFQVSTGGVYTIADSTPQLMFRSCWVDGGAVQEDEMYRTSGTGWPGVVSNMRFYYGASTNPSPVSPTSVTFIPDQGTAADAVTITKVSSAQPEYWQITMNDFGSGRLAVTDANGTYDLPITISLPMYGFYTERNPSTETYRNALVYEDLRADENGNKNIWVMKIDCGFNWDECPGIQVKEVRDAADGTQRITQADYTWVPRTGETNSYDLKITLPEVAGQDHYSIWFMLSPDVETPYITIDVTSRTPETPVIPVIPSVPSTSTDTTTNPDGSTTTTVTDNRTGAVTETTKLPDGTKTTTKTNGTGTVTEVSAQISTAAVNTAAENDAAVTLPISLEASAASAQALTVDITLPQVDQPVTVEIPVTNATVGTVVILVHEDGTEEILKDTVPTKNGVAFPLEESASIKLVDNTKTMDDVQEDDWSYEAVTFAVSRELFNGTGVQTFSPKDTMTRGMLMTVLARYAGEDAYGETWKEDGMAWSVENGISDGSNPDEPITREQLVTMLWRYAGKPSSSKSLDGYTDSSQISGYAQEAMAWAVENGIMSGYGNGILGPQDSATREQVAQFLMNFITY